MRRDDFGHAMALCSPLVILFCFDHTSCRAFLLYHFFLRTAPYILIALGFFSLQSAVLEST